MSVSWATSSPEKSDSPCSQDVDLAVQDAPLVGDLVLLLGELVDQLLQLLVAEGTKIGKGVLHLAPWVAGSRPSWAAAPIIGAHAPNVQLKVEGYGE
jgi:hypothetical protein